MFASFLSFNTQRNNLEELLRLSRDKAASGINDELKSTSCLLNKLLELEASIHLLKIYLVPKLLFPHVEHSLFCSIYCQGKSSILASSCIRRREIKDLGFSRTAFLPSSGVLQVLLKEEIGGSGFVICRLEIGVMGKKTAGRSWFLSADMARAAGVIRVEPPSGVCAEWNSSRACNLVRFVRSLRHQQNAQELMLKSLLLQYFTAFFGRTTEPYKESQDLFQFNICFSSEHS